MALSNQISFNLALRPSQGVGFSQNTGDAFVYPFDGVQPVTVYDDMDQPHLVMLDRDDRTFYDIYDRDGPYESNTRRQWKDKVTFDGTGGTWYDLILELPEDIGDMEHYSEELKRSHLTVLPFDESKKDADGYDANAYPNDLTMIAEAFCEGASSTANAAAKDISLPKHEISFDTVLPDAHRTYLRYTLSRPQVWITSAINYYVTKDVPPAPDARITSEQAYQREASAPDSWLGLFDGQVTDFANGERLEVDADVSTSPDGRSGGVSFSDTLSLPAVSLSGGSIFLWCKNLSALKVGGVEVVLSDYSDPVNGWTLKYATGITAAGVVTVEPAGTGEIFDYRAVSVSLSSGFFDWYYTNASNNNGNKAFPRF